MGVTRQRQDRSTIARRAAVPACTEIRSERSGVTSAATSARRSSGNVFAAVGGDGHGSTYMEASPSVSYRPSSFLKISEGVNFSRNYDDSQWIEETDGALRVRPDSPEDGRPADTRQLHDHAQAFDPDLRRAIRVGGDYSDFKALVDGRAPVYEDRYAPFAYTGNPDFNYRSFRTTNVLRWEYKPGSTLFVVWQQGREGNTRPGHFRLLARLPRRVLVGGEERVP